MQGEGEGGVRMECVFGDRGDEDPVLVGCVGAQELHHYGEVADLFQRIFTHSRGVTPVEVEVVESTVLGGLRWRPWDKPQQVRVKCAVPSASHESAPLRHQKWVVTFQRSQGVEMPPQDPALQGDGSMSQKQFVPVEEEAEDSQTTTKTDESGGGMVCTLQ